MELFNEQNYTDFNEDHDNQLFPEDDIPEIIKRPHQPKLVEEDDSEITFLIASLTMN
jgi:hypothetical protein